MSKANGGNCRAADSVLHYTNQDGNMPRKNTRVTARKKSRADADGGWKDIIEEFTEEFFEFYFPEVHAAIDFDVGPKFLDAELREIVPDAEVAGREADRLIELRLKDGTIEWLLIHVEVQGYPDTSFAERMFIYNYRIFDKYHRDVISLSVLADSDPEFRPTEYQRDLLGCRQTFTFPMVKLIDYEPAQLEASSSPFALVTQIHLEYLAAGGDPQKRFDARVALTRQLYDHGSSRNQIVGLYRFLGFLMRLPDNLAIKYRQVVETIEGELEMPYITDTERLAKSEGVAEGRTEGQLQRAREVVIEALEIRFDSIPYALREEINHVNSDRKLKKLHRLAITAKSLANFTV